MRWERLGLGVGLALSVGLSVALGLIAGCSKKAKGTGDGASISCAKLYDRNRQCADQLVASLSSIDGLSSSQRAKLAKNMREQFTTHDYLSMCKTGRKDRHKLSKRIQAEAKQFDADIVKCHAKSDCTAYATCYAAALRKR